MIISRCVQQDHSRIVSFISALFEREWEHDYGHTRPILETNQKPSGEPVVRAESPRKTARILNSSPCSTDLSLEHHKRSRIQSYFYSP